MVNEAVRRNKLQEAGIDFTVADGTAIEKGTVCALNDPRTAIASSAEGDVLAGIATREKVASDGRTQLSMDVRGIFDMKASGAVVLGAPVHSSGSFNEVITSSNTDFSGAAILGYALETASDGETFQVMVNIGGGNGK